MKWESLKKSSPIQSLKVEIAYISTGTGSHRQNWKSVGWIIDGVWSIECRIGISNSQPTHYKLL